MNETVDELNKKCKKCGHTKAKHFCPIANLSHDDPRFIAGVCNEEKCECEKFEHNEK